MDSDGCTKCCTSEADSEHGTDLEALAEVLRNLSLVERERLAELLKG